MPPQQHLPLQHAAESMRAVVPEEEQKKKEKWVRIDDTEYDVTNFKHPGGSVINYMLTSLGADATETFREFHMRSKKAPGACPSGGSRKPTMARSASADSPPMISGIFRPSRRSTRGSASRRAAWSVRVRFASVALLHLN